MKKLLSIVLCLITCISMVTPALATEFSGTTGVVPSEPLTDSGKCGDSATWTLTEKGDLTISGTGAMYSYDGSYAPWYDSIADVTKLVIEEGITSIGENAFSNLEKLTSITFPSTLNEIKRAAFVGCTALTSITLPDGVTAIEMYTFMGCDNLTTVKLGNNVTSIGEGAFMQCFKLTSINIPDSVISIGMDVFFRCEKLSTVVLGSKVVSVASSAFSSCSSLANVFYKGTEAQKNSIMFAMNNEQLINATWHYEVKESGNRLYCPDCNKYFGYDGKSIVAITAQPKSVTVAEGAKAVVSVNATGDGLKYYWYFKNPGASKFSYTSTFTGSTYSVSLSKDRSGRQIYCYVTDKYGNSVKSDTVTLTVGNVAKITTQPTSVTVANGKTARTTVKATGDGLTYKWYFKNKGASTFSYTSAYKTASYSVPMDSTRDGRQVYCVVTDKYGNSVTSRTVTLNMEHYAKITEQPKSVMVSDGSKATVTVKATGDGLKYYWYFKNPGATKFSYTSTFTGNTYSVSLAKERSGRQVYCYVVDKYGNSVKSDVATLTVGNTVKITKQPASVAVAEGAKAVITVNATGDGLKYYWYFKNPGAAKFSYTSTFTSNTYSVALAANRSGRQVYCYVVDKYGNSVKSNTVTITVGSAVKITSQPQNVTVSVGAKATVTVKATGEGLTYKWYFKNPDATKFSYTSTFSGNTYSVALAANRSGRQVYCVITDKYGNSVKSNTVTLKTY